MDFLRVIAQQGPMDCAVASLAMLLELSYADAYVEVAKVDRYRSKRGLYVNQIKKVAQSLGRPLRLTRKFDPEEAVGILAVDIRNVPWGHVVILWRGIIVETDSTIWEYDTYLAVNKAIPRSLLVLKEDAV